MTQPSIDRLFISTNGLKQAIGPDDPEIRAYYETLIAADYDRCRPDDTFEDLKRRARFSKEDQGVLNDWMTLAADRARERERQADTACRLAA